MCAKRRRLAGGRRGIGVKPAATIEDEGGESEWRQFVRQERVEQKAECGIEGELEGEHRPEAQVGKTERAELNIRNRKVQHGLDAQRPGVESNAQAIAVENRKAGECVGQELKDALQFHVLRFQVEREMAVLIEGE